MELDHLLHLIILDKLIVRYLHDNINNPSLKYYHSIFHRYYEESIDAVYRY